MKDITIIGGGLAGLTVAILLAENGVPCRLIEKRNYPFHRVCGEYISNEVKSFLDSRKLIPTELNFPAITQFQLSSVKGRTATIPLDLGGFGISRYYFDHFLYEKAKSAGVEFF